MKKALSGLYRPGHKRLIVLTACLMAVFCTIFLAGCGTGTVRTHPSEPLLPPQNPPGGSTLLSVNTQAGDALARMLLQRISLDKGILVASFVRFDALDETTSFGRLSAQQVSSRVAQYGFRVFDIRLAGAMRMDHKGEFMLSRDTAKTLLHDYDAHAVIAGVYTPSGSRVFVSVRVIRLIDTAVIAAYEYYLPVTGDTDRLLGRGGAESGAENDAIWRQYATRGRAFSEEGRTAGVSEQKSSVPAPRAPVMEKAVPVTPVDKGPTGSTVVKQGGEPLPAAPEYREGGRHIAP